jgi:hypothetical protein
VLAAFLPAWAAGTVRFLTPVSGRPALGPTQVALALMPPEGATPVRIVIQLDGRQVAVLTEPPWTLLLDLGGGEKDRSLTATATFSDGSTARDSSRVTSGASRRRRSPPGASLPCATPGALVTDLGRRLPDHGEREAAEIERFSTERRPLRWRWCSTFPRA